MTEKQKLANSLIIFGGTGDLTKRKIIPAIYNLCVEDELPDEFFVIAVGRRDWDVKYYVNMMKESVKEFSRNSFQDTIWEKIAQRIYYYKLNFDAKEEYLDFDKYLCALERTYKTKGNRNFYLAVSPEYFGTIAEKIHQYGLDDTKGSARLIIEKPFGKDLASASELNRKIVRGFGEENTYRIDHYLGKEMLQNIMVVRFANAFFEPIWNNKFIDNIQITSFEKLGVNERGGYYESAGALKDMLQNHLLQLLSITAMEPPAILDTEAIRDEKVKVLKSLRLYKEEELRENVIRGQYGDAKDQSIIGYRKENRVADDSNTETYVALKAHIDNFRWAGVPFYIRTGKRMEYKSVEVVVQFKSLSKILYLKGMEESMPNQLIIRIQPTEGIYLRFNAKKPGQSYDVVPVNMDYCQNCNIAYNSPEAYERLLLDAMKGEKTLFTRWDEVEHSWRFIDSIAKAWEEQVPDFPNYTAGSLGPVAADELLEKEGRKWHNESV